jgi:gamma-glutamyl-gamma-aminobutyrate hydrolase PuuD
MKLVINTQYRENYAAHDEGYEHGVSEAYWKFKGGTTYVVPRFTDVNNITQVMKKLDSLISYGNPGSEQ